MTKRLALLLAIAPMLFAQSQESVTVSITNVDVVVTDAKGNRVRGLPKDEFTILDNGEVREITNFTEFARVTPNADEGAPPAAGGASTSLGMTQEPAARRLLIFADDATLTMANRKLFVPAAHAFVDANVRPGDRVMIVSAAQSVKVRLPWTMDKAAVHAMLDTIGNDATVGGREMERKQLEEQIRQDMLTDKMQNGGDSKGSAVTFTRFVGLVRGYAARQVAFCRNTVSSLGAAMTAFPRSPERKVVLFVGEGLPLHPGEEMWHYLETIRMQAESDLASAGVKQGANTAMPLTEAHDYDITPQVRALAESAHQRGIVVYPLNPGTNDENAVENLRAVDKSAEFARVAANMTAYQTIAHETGGLAFLGARPTIALTHLARDLDSYYSLGYRTPDAAKSANVVVKSKHNYKVRVIIPDAPGSSESLVQDTVLANHVTTPASNDLGIKLLADPPVADGEKRKVSLKVMIPVSALKFDKAGAEVVGGFNVYIATGDARGNTSEVNKQMKELRWPADALAHLAGKSITFAVDILLEPGRDQISVGVMDQKSEKTGFDRITL